MTIEFQPEPLVADSDTAARESALASLHDLAVNR